MKEPLGEPIMPICLSKPKKAKSTATSTGKIIKHKVATVAIPELHIASTIDSSHFEFESTSIESNQHSKSSSKDNNEKLLSKLRLELGQVLSLQSDLKLKEKRMRIQIKRLLRKISFTPLHSPSHSTVVDESINKNLTIQSEHLSILFPKTQHVSQSLISNEQNQHQSSRVWNLTSMNENFEELRELTILKDTNIVEFKDISRVNDLKAIQETQIDTIILNESNLQEEQYDSLEPLLNNDQELDKTLPNSQGTCIISPSISSESLSVKFTIPTAQINNPITPKSALLQKLFQLLDGEDTESNINESSIMYTV